MVGMTRIAALLLLCVCIYFLLLTDIYILEEQLRVPKKKATDACMAKMGILVYLLLAASMASTNGLDIVDVFVPIPPAQEDVTSDYDSCVSLLVYADNDCSGNPIKAATFSTWSKKGSPCCESIKVTSLSFCYHAIIPITAL